jgi:hypothetical protein
LLNDSDPVVKANGDSDQHKNGSNGSNVSVTSRREIERSLEVVSWRSEVSGDILIGLTNLECNSPVVARGEPVRLLTETM